MFGIVSQFAVHNLEIATYLEKYLKEDKLCFLTLFQLPTA